MLLDQWTTTNSDNGSAIDNSGLAQEASLDAVMPEPVVRLRQSVTVRRMPEAVFAAAQGARGSGSLFAALLEAPRPLGRAMDAAPVKRCEDGWIAALEDAPRRMVAGAVGRLWDTEPGVHAVHDLEELRRLVGPGACGITLELRFRPGRGRTTRLTAELRIDAADETTARRLQAHWRMSALGVHIAVRSLLSAVRQGAESTES
jgi:hypothetical protein